MCVARTTTNEAQHGKLPKMMMNTTLNQLRSLRLETMAQALEQQLTQSGISAMSFEERLALLVDRE